MDVVRDFLEVVRDLLDEQVLDRNGERIGKVDGVILEIREGGPPRVAAIEIGLPTAVRRLEIGWLERWVRRWARSTRIPMTRVVAIGRDIRVDVDADETSATDVERWLRRHVIERIPGGRGCQRAR